MNAETSTAVEPRVPVPGPASSGPAGFWRGGPGAVLRRVLTVGEIGVLIPLVVAVLVFVSLEPAFLSGNNLQAMLKGMSFIGIIAVGQTLLLVSGEFDLSVGSVAGLSAVCSAWSMTHLHLPTPVGLLVGLAVGGLVGMVNGFVVVKLKIPAFIATIGMLYMARGVTYLISKGYPIYPLPKSVGQIGSNEILHLSYSFVILVVLTLAGEFLLRRTTFGRSAFAVGGNAEVARIAGINSNRVKFVCFTVVGVLAGLAGMLVMASVASASSDIGSGYELNVIAGVVIGGVSLFGGIGNVTGAFLGVLLLQVVQSGLVIVGLDANWQTVAVGLIMVGAVGIDIVRRRARVA